MSRWLQWFIAAFLVYSTIGNYCRFKESLGLETTNCSLRCELRDMERNNAKEDHRAQAQHH